MSTISTEGVTTTIYLADKTKILAPMIGKTLASLEEKGFVNISRSGKTKKIALSDSKHALLFRDMSLEFKHIKFEKYLSGSVLEVLSAIGFLKLATIKEIHQNCNVSEPSAARTISKLRKLGVVQKREEGYSISQRFERLKDFVIEFRHYMNTKSAKNFSKDYVILWEQNDVFIIESSTKKGDEGNFHLTGPSVFGKFGIKLFMTSSYHYHSPREKQRGLEKSIIHTFLIPLSQRVVLPVLLVWKKNEKKMNKKYLYNTAEKYGTKNRIDEVYKYFETKGAYKPEYFPTWKEFASKAKEYGLRV
ncbi:hypothetical protein [Nitrosopumilus ureiphilus]|nr:hypothetical protein [Nitrosopumilus ureiphilus]